MFKKEITFTDFNDEQVTETHYFHLSMAEITELELSHEGGLSETLKKIVVAEDGKGIVKMFQDIIMMSYGVKSEDGRRFIKTEELRDEFMQTGAYSELFMELATNTNAAIEFVNGLIPKGMAERVQNMVEEKGVEKAKTDQSTGEPKLAAVPETPETPEKPEQEVRVITRSELEAMPHEDIAQMYMDVSAGKVRIEDDPPSAS